jgi:hypothetical protein
LTIESRTIASRTTARAAMEANGPTIERSITAVGSIDTGGMITVPGDATGGVAGWLISSSSRFVSSSVSVLPQSYQPSTVNGRILCPFSIMIWSASVSWYSPFVRMSF